MMFPKPTPRPREKPRGLQRSRMEKKLPRRLQSAEDDTPFRRFVVQLGCVVRDLPGATPCRGPIQPAHLTLSANEKGTGMKVPDRQCAGMCSHHHDEWDGRDRSAKSTFAGWDKPERYGQARIWVDRMNLAATPEDRESALALADLGLGRIVDGDGGRWTWEPGPVREEMTA